jgi:hypothetical protein
MEEQVTVVMCKQCRKALDEPSDTPIEERAPCPDCGFTSRDFDITVRCSVSIQSGVRGKARSVEAGRPGGRPWLTMMSELSWSHDYQKWVHREKTENRRDGLYTEVVTDPDTGKIIHQSPPSERLSEHQGHGSAKKKRDT